MVHSDCNHKRGKESIVRSVFFSVQVFKFAFDTFLRVTHSNEAE